MASWGLLFISIMKLCFLSLLTVFLLKIRIRKKSPALFMKYEVVVLSKMSVYGETTIVVNRLP